ncbi:MAG: hypothetical protein ABUK01_15010 [Leptospirales bacterium]
MIQKPNITIYQRGVKPLPGPMEPEFTYLLSLSDTSQTVILPEYFSIHQELSGIDEIINYSKQTLEWLTALSAHRRAQDTLIVGGTLLHRNVDNTLSNVAPILFNGELVYSYEKRKLFGKEASKLRPGVDPGIFTHPATKDPWGFLICADVKIPNVFTQYQKQKFLAIPTASPYLPEDTPEQRDKRDYNIYVKGAEISGSTIFKCCSTGTVATGGPISSVQGRSLIASGHKVLALAPEIDWQGALCFDTENKTAEYRPYNND